MSNKKKNLQRRVRIFLETLTVVKNGLETLREAFKQIVHQIKISVAKNTGFLPQLDNIAADSSLAKSKNLVVAEEKAECIEVQKIGGANDTADSNILGLKIAKVTEDVLNLDNALKRLQAAKEHVRTEVSSAGKEYASGVFSRRQYLPFLLGDKLYAVGTATVQEVLQAARVLVDSNAPEKVRSAINLDGAVVPVIDLSLHLGGEMTKVDRNTLIIILLLNLDGRLQKIGIKVDCVGKIIMVDCSDVVSVRDRAESVRSDLITGELKTEHYSIALLDFNRWHTLSSVLGLRHQVL